jgi:hypothetical protein
MQNKGAVGFKIDKIPFGKGSERLAYCSQEADSQEELLGKVMVAKASRRFVNETKKLRFHEHHFCRIMSKQKNWRIYSRKPSPKLKH